MEKMYRVLLANGSEEFCGKLGVALKQTNRYSVVGSACDGVRAISLLKERNRICWSSTSCCRRRTACPC